MGLENVRPHLTGYNTSGLSRDQLRKRATLQSLLIASHYITCMMLCYFCSQIDIDELATERGYLHHASCSDLRQSAENGCESCNLILTAQWKFYAGDLDTGSDLGSLSTQIVARVVHQKPGAIHSIRYGQEERWHALKDKATVNESPFLWGFLSVAAEQNSRVAKLMKLEVLPQRTVEERLSLASIWLKNCLDCHDKCSLQSQDYVDPPTRVIDVGPSDGSRDPYLRTSGNDVREWITLSHCWGEAQPFKTTKETLSSHESSLALDRLPKLFQDAVSIVRALGYRFLWVDSLCIIQDSEEDWQKEVSNMGNIYKDCVFMISADFCHNNSESILSHLTRKQYIFQECHSSKEGFHCKMATYLRTNEEAEKLSRGILQTRAWALQEEVLSPRTLKWTQEQLIWECRASTFSEEFPRIDDSPKLLGDFMGQYSFKVICLPKDILRQKPPIPEGAIDAGEEDPLVLWYRILKNFSCRQISYPTDTLPAISGIAREVARHTGFKYRAGLWAEDFHNGLLWSTEGSWEHRRTDAGPSWSWASMCSDNFISSAALIVPFNHEEHYVMPEASILSVDIKYSGRDEFSGVTSGKIHLRGLCKPIVKAWQDITALENSGDDEESFYDSPRWAHAMPWIQFRGRSPHFRLDHRSAENEEGAVTELQKEGAIVVQIARCCFRKRDIAEKELADLDEMELKAATLYEKLLGLILRPAQKPNEYSRIGVAVIASMKDAPEGWEAQDIEII